MTKTSTTNDKDILLNILKFWETNQKRILTIIGGLAVIIGGWYAYQSFIVAPKEQKAQETLYKAEEYFAQDSSRKTLDGDGTAKGVLYVIKNYSGTKAANLAHYYAGISYLKLGEFNKAVEHLKEFSSDSKPIQMVAYGALADAYSELKKNDLAIENYKKAANTFTIDELTSAEYLWRAGQLLEIMNKPTEALAVYKEIKTKFPKAKAGEIDKYIYRLSIEKNEFSVN
ncbi:MAG: tetratricopeptide repeat protein [Chitinophagaceae bacterium]|nr:tetratricopeptide repeat protein [Chitinophagaceae bacterium]